MAGYTESRPGSSASHKWLRTGTMLVVAAGSGAFVMQQLWPVIQGWSQPDSRSGATTPGPLSRVVSDSALSSRNNVGSEGSTGPSQLLLTATAPGKSPRDGTAQIGTSASHALTYVAGALLLNGARLTEIYADRVMLERDGRSVPLYLPGAGPNPHANSDDILTVASRPAPPAVASDAGATTPPAQGSDITEYIRPNPVYDAGRLRGFQLYAGMKSAVFMQMGLVAGDLIVAIDDAPATDPSQVMDSFQQLMTGGAFDITVERQGRVEHLNVDGAAIVAEQTRAQESRSDVERGSPAP